MMLYKLTVKSPYRFEAAAEKQGEGQNKDNQ